MNEIIELLSSRCGRYEGRGLNNERQVFYGELEMECVVKNCGIAIAFKAIGEDRNVYHEEQSLITLNNMHELYFYTLSSNTDYMLPMEFRKHEQIDYARSSITFGYGMANDVSSFREEVSILLWYNGDLEYIYRWGIPGGDFRLRSKTRMKKMNSSRW